MKGSNKYMKVCTFFLNEERETRFKGDFSMKLATTLTILAIAFFSNSYPGTN